MQNPSPARAADDASPMNAPTLALLYPGDRALRDRADPAESRFAALFAAFAAAGVPAEPAVWHDDVAAEVRAQLMGRVAGVLVWCNPIEGGRRRDRLDALLRDVAAAGSWVSAHPDAVLALGTKDVLVATRGLPFGCDVQPVDSPAQLRAELPARLRAGARVLKQHRGHSGIGVWRVAFADAAGDPRRLRVQHAQRGSDEAIVDLDTLIAMLAPYFAPEAGGHMVDQAWQPRLVDGMLRAYLVGDRVAGFGHQAVNALFPATPGAPAPLPGARLYHDADHAPAQALRRQLESGWVEALRAAVGLPAAQLPLLWDCDFIPGDAPGRFVLCEVNVSSVAPFPPSAIAPLVAAARARLAG